MSTSAIIMMLVSMIVVWGGLLAAAINLMKHPGSEAHEFSRDL